MLNFLSPYTIWLKLGLVVVMVAGWPLYYVEKTNYKLYQDQVAQTAATAAVKAKQQEIQNEETNARIAQTYNDYYQQLLAKQLRHQSSGSSMPTSSQSSGSTDETGASCRGTPFYFKALQAELMLETWQKWAMDQGLGVEGNDNTTH